MAVAVRNERGGPTGSVAFFSTDLAAGDDPIEVLEVGFGPDMLTFTPDGSKVLVANQGRPSDDYEIDPEGSVSIIDVSGGYAVTTVDFTEFNGKEDELRAQLVQGLDTHFGITSRKLRTDVLQTTLLKQSMNVRLVAGDHQ